VKDQGYETPTKLRDFWKIYRDWSISPPQLQDPVPDYEWVKMMEGRGHTCRCLSFTWTTW